MPKETVYQLALAADAELVVRFTTDKTGITIYRVVLIATRDGAEHTIRLFDNTHGAHDMHRYEKGMKQPAENFCDGTPTEAMYAALDSITTSYREMIESWER